MYSTSQACALHLAFLWYSYQLLVVCIAISSKEISPPCLTYLSGGLNPDLESLMLFLPFAQSAHVHTPHLFACFDIPTCTTMNFFLTKSSDKKRLYQCMYRYNERRVSDNGNLGHREYISNLVLPTAASGHKEFSSQREQGVSRGLTEAHTD